MPVFLHYLERKFITSKTFITFYNILFLYFIILHALYFICFYLNINIEIISCKEFRWCGLYAGAAYLLYIKYFKAKFVRCGLYDGAAYLPEITVVFTKYILHPICNFLKLLHVIFLISGMPYKYCIWYFSFRTKRIFKTKQTNNICWVSPCTYAYEKATLYLLIKRANLHSRFYEIYFAFATIKTLSRRELKKNLAFLI